MADEKKRITLKGVCTSIGKPSKTKKGRAFVPVSVFANDQEYRVKIMADTYPAENRGKEVTFENVYVNEWQGEEYYAWYPPGSGRYGGNRFQVNYRVKALECASRVYAGKEQGIKVIEIAELYLMWLEKNKAFAPVADEPKQEAASTKQPSQDDGDTHDPDESDQDIPF